MHQSKLNGVSGKISWFLTDSQVKYQSGFDQVLIEMLMECWLRCHSRVNWGINGRLTAYAFCTHNHRNFFDFVLLKCPHKVNSCLSTIEIPWNHAWLASLNWLAHCVKRRAFTVRMSALCTCGIFWYMFVTMERGLFILTRVFSVFLRTKNIMCSQFSSLTVNDIEKTLKLLKKILSKTFLTHFRTLS